MLVASEKKKLKEKTIFLRKELEVEQEDTSEEEKILKVYLDLGLVRDQDLDLGLVLEHYLEIELSLVLELALGLVQNQDPNQGHHLGIHLHTISGICLDGFLQVGIAKRLYQVAAGT